MASFNSESERLVKDLNSMVPVQQTIAFLVPRTREWVNRLKSTPEYILISPGPKDVPIPVLPKEWLRMKAPVELWIRGKEEGKNSRALVELWSTVAKGIEKLQPSKVETAGKVEGFAVTAVGEWWVVKLGADLVEEILEKKKE